MGNPARSGWVRPARESKQSSRPAHGKQLWDPPARAGGPIVPFYKSGLFYENRMSVKTPELKIGYL